MEITELTNELEERLRSILFKFSGIRDSWKQYNDQIIPEDQEFVKEIVQFYIDLIDYMITNIDEIDKEEYREFLKDLHFRFYYGPNGDDRNYLDIDEGELTYLCSELIDKELTVELLEKIKKKYVEILDKL
ncbi:hypothetical protein KY330_03975 [Candidatus Woesearchaeota archaeon]|nr:hypothetical protein [Candidatus Woesearchaeota archaeon]